MLPKRAADVNVQGYTMGKQCVGEIFGMRRALTVRLLRSFSARRAANLGRSVARHRASYQSLNPVYDRL